MYNDAIEKKRSHIIFAICHRHYYKLPIYKGNRIPIPINNNHIIETIFFYYRHHHHNNNDNWKM